jgi:hypothetical protein
LQLASDNFVAESLEHNQGGFGYFAVDIDGYLD